jgi:hypothetical protein
MNHSLFSPLVGVAVCLAAVLVPGCGGGPAIDVAPVKGKVTVEGQPVTSGQVSFLPESQDIKGGMSAGQIDSNGQYTINTAGKAGAPPGKYKVTITPTMVPAQGATKPPSTPFNSKYSDPQKTPLTVEVTKSPAPDAYDLKLTK